MAKRKNTTRQDVVTIGAATRDVFVKSSRFERMPSDSAPDGWNACLPMGAKIDIDHLEFETGGGATNAAVTFARWGLTTSCISRVGQDPGGQEIIAQLQRERIETRAIQHDPTERTGYSIIFLAGAGNRTVLVARGASKHIDTREIPWKSLKTRWIYLTSVGGDMNVLKDVFAHAKKTLAHIAWNPGNSELELGLKKLAPFLMQSDILILNRNEAAELADTTPRHLDRVMKKLGQLPRQILVVTDGKHGAYAHMRGSTWYAPALHGTIVNTTGAGDAFGSGFIASLMTDSDIGTALKAATLNAFGVTTHMGAKAGILKKMPGTRDLARVKIREVR